MPEDRIATITDSGDPVTTDDKSSQVVTDDNAEAGVSSIPDRSSASNSDLVGTLDVSGDTVTEPEGAIKTEDQDVEDKGKGENEETPGKEDDETRYDRIPRFQELIKERDAERDQRIAAQAKIDVYEKEKPVEKEIQSEYQDVLEMTNEEITEKFNEDPKAFLANYARQQAFEILDVVDTQSKTKSQQDMVNETYAKYAKNNPDYMEKLNSGQIGNFMRDNPGHNAFSAHMILSAEEKNMQTEEVFQKRQDEAVKKAVDELKADFKAKRESSVLGADASNVGIPLATEGVPAELKDTKKMGGPVNALVARLQARRKAQALG